MNDKKEKAVPQKETSETVAAGKQTYAHSDRRNSSIEVGPKTIATVAGPINEWACKPENLPNHPTMAFFGKRRTGKSTTITNIAYHCCQNIPFGIVMSDTAYAGYWEKILPKRHIVQGLRQDVLDWLIQRQSAAVAKYGVKDPRIAAFVILDDVIADQKTIRWSADLARFFVQGYCFAFFSFVLCATMYRSNSLTRRVSSSLSCCAFPMSSAYFFASRSCLVLRTVYCACMFFATKLAALAFARLLSHSSHSHHLAAILP